MVDLDFVAMVASPQTHIVQVVLGINLMHVVPMQSNGEENLDESQTWPCGCSWGTVCVKILD